MKSIRKSPEQQAEELAVKLADKPYGQSAEKTVEIEKESEQIVRTSFALPKSVLLQLEDQALANKRKGVEPKTVSQILRDALAMAGYK
ncbi:hypothetical protein [Lonepinella sp. BR2271]|uniref:hypothetical protein n=1 Tax=Lonepinella sp. BR2271 TaxID=3434550 RepID=UPI003F6DFCD5